MARSGGFSPILTSAEECDRLPDTNINFKQWPLPLDLRRVLAVVSCILEYDQVHRNIQLIYKLK